LHQVGTSSLLIYMMHGHTYIKLLGRYSPSFLVRSFFPIYRSYNQMTAQLNHTLQ